MGTRMLDHCSKVMRGGAQEGESFIVCIVLRARKKSGAEANLVHKELFGANQVTALCCCAYHLGSGVACVLVVHLELHAVSVCCTSFIVCECFDR
jgi:hypothetical protein